ncbi:S-adenosyl-L-homocysteine hydrolase [Neptunicoccus cionae]|uniref:Lipoprotein n=1 Tax=Neptunicoccus cionae TaxID=2035344 RepID=A0A916QWG0_9RHOB|nr:S-adenosyl-L-homocysteine hydrolase [Amylibacter cionae]GGA18298.1 hypothetical protein GCM10011498_18710 [Amylibacter cionae]
MKRFFIALTTAVLASTTAQATTSCMDSEEMEAALVDWYAEKAVGPKIDRDETEIQLWASEQNGTWTLVSYYESGQSCVIAQGDHTTPEPDLQQQEELYSMLVVPNERAL